MNGHGKSHSPLVPAKSPNKDYLELSASDGKPQTGTKGETPDTAKGEPKANDEVRDLSAEGMEGRGLAEGNLSGQNVPRTLNRTSTPSALEQVGEVARRDKQVRFTTLLHHVYNLETLRRAYLKLKREAAPGVDGMTWREYGEQLETKLEDLSLRLKRGAYRAKPVRRVLIPKPDGRQRPLGVTALEDKVVQRALVDVLDQIYEADFLGFSYGFRPGRSQHDALDALAVGITEKKVHWVLDMDIRDFFGTIDHGWLVRFVEHRIADRRIVRLIQKWLKAGVLEDGERQDTEEGTPQGGVVSPLLANIYLHHVFDLWAQHWRRQANGDVIVVRYADDIVMGFQKEADARRFWEDVAERFAKFGLELSPEKTRLLSFGRRAAARGRRSGRGKPETFDFLGFTHVCGKTPDGKFQLLRLTSRKRMRRKLSEVKAELRRRLHRPVPEVGKWLRSVIQGHVNYYGVPLNLAALKSFRYQVIRRWRHALSRRSQNGDMAWARVSHLARLWLPPVRITHPNPSERLCLTT